MAERVVIVIPTYNGVDSLRFQLDTILRNDPVDVPILVVEDPCGKPEVRQAYDLIPKEFPSLWVTVVHLAEWSNMHGAAMRAFELAFHLYDPEWIIYMGDDAAITKGALSNLIHFVTANELKTIGLVQPAYWNAQALCGGGKDGQCDEKGAIPLFFTKESGFYTSIDWTDKVPRNPHWDGTDTDMAGLARVYVNVNGVGFACHADTYRQVGGFAEGTWCLDESISYRVWTGSDRGVVCLPGPPLVHYFGRSTFAGPPAHDLYTEERWTEAIGYNKSECDKIMRRIMGDREDAIHAECKGASYWTK